MSDHYLKKHLNCSVVGLTALLACSAIAVPAPSMAQVRSSGSNTTGMYIAQVDRAVTAYTLGANDRLRVDVFEVPEYSGEFTVLVDGTLNLPVIGSVLVRGLTLEQATEVISSRYARFVRRPIVTLNLLAPRPVNIAVSGEVIRPGTYSVAPGGGGGGAAGGAASQFPTVTQAITLAGGITQSAAIGDVIVRRRTGSVTTQQINVNLRRLLQEGDLTQDISLRDGDTVFIPTITADNRAESRQLADASFAPRDIRPINVAVVGEINRPGTYSVAGGGVGTRGATGAITGGGTGVNAGGGGDAGLPTVTKAIQVAGGITSLADVRGITIRRTTRSGETKVINVNLWSLLRAGDRDEDILLQEGDIITIPTATALDPAEANALGSASFAPNTIVVNVVGEVARPGAIPIPPNTPLNQAVQAAGGFNPRARKRSVDLIRLNPNGTVTKRDIDIDLAQGIDEQKNPTLRNNDVIVVRRNTLASVGDSLTNLLNPVGNLINIFGLFRILGGN
ncbi:MAG: SLBB domain-containing protein [Coleofasciculus sp. Co-bin14]|nr:SLBB domain-containing protein [Coleofasciculus sp. Co-bin14]